MKKLVCLSLCLSMLFGLTGCGTDSTTDENDSPVEDVTKSTLDQLKETSLKSTSVDEFKDEDVIEKALIDYGFTYKVLDGTLGLIAPSDSDIGHIAYATSSGSKSMAIQFKNGNQIILFETKDFDSTFILGDNNNLQWDMSSNKVSLFANDKTDDSEENLKDILELKTTFNKFYDSAGISLFELNFILQLYQRVLIDNVNLMDIKMKEWE